MIMLDSSKISDHLIILEQERDVIRNLNQLLASEIDSPDILLSDMLCIRNRISFLEKEKKAIEGRLSFLSRARELALDLRHNNSFLLDEAMDLLNSACQID